MIPPIARRFIAGESPAAALNHAGSMNKDDVNVILNLLGEHYDSPEPANADAKAYLELIGDISQSDVKACISVKPSQIGLDVSTDLFAENFHQIVTRAHNNEVFVWCDMEDADTTDATLNTFEDLAKEYPWTVGQCFQSNLRRTRDDLKRVVDLPAKLRLVKGAYDEPSSIAYTEKRMVDKMFKRDIKYLVQNRDRGIAVASHDPEMISHTRSLADNDTEYEFQMLMGVRERTQRELASQGIEVWQYAPYGNKWLSYFYRRVRERKENLLFAARAITGR